MASMNFSGECCSIVFLVDSNSNISMTLIIYNKMNICGIMKSSAIGVLPFLKATSLPIRFGFLTEKPRQSQDLIFIRHAESVFNQACQEYRVANNIPYVWKELCNHEGFDQSVLFNTKYMDCPITQKGRKQCRKTRNLLEEKSIDCVLVSPQLRALQTCQQIFQGKFVPIFVEPLLVGPLRSCSDVNRPTNIKKAMFAEYDFSRTENYQQLWYLDYLSSQHQQMYKKHFKENKIESIESQRVEIVRLLKDKKIHEDALTFRRRVQSIKQMIMGYKQKYQNIAVVTHYYTIQYLSAIEYHEDGSPSFYLDIKNCKPYYASVSDLTAAKEDLNEIY